MYAPFMFTLLPNVRVKMNSTKLYSEITCVAWHFLIVRHCISYSYIHGPAVRYLCSRSPNQAFWLHHAQSIYLRPQSHSCTYCTLPMCLPRRTNSIVPMYLPHHTHVPTVPYPCTSCTVPYPCTYRAVPCTCLTVPTPLRTVPVCVLHRPYRNKPSMILEFGAVGTTWNLII